MELVKCIYLFLRKITKLTNLSPELQKIKSMNQYSTVVNRKRANPSGESAGRALTRRLPPPRGAVAVSGLRTFGSKVATGVRRRRRGARAEPSLALRHPPRRDFSFLNYNRQLTSGLVNLLEPRASCAGPVLIPVPFRPQRSEYRAPASYLFSRFRGALQIAYLFYYRNANPISRDKNSKAH